jgi:hypothetical protein
VRLTNSPPSCAECHGNLRDQTSWNTLGHTGPVTGILYLIIIVIIIIIIINTHELSQELSANPKLNKNFTKTLLWSANFFREKGRTGMTKLIVAFHTLRTRLQTEENAENKRDTSLCYALNLIGRERIRDCG